MASHYIKCLKLDTTYLDGIQNFNLDPGVALALLSGDSAPYNTYATIDRIRPVLPFSSVHVAEHHTLFGIDGYEISANPLEAWCVDADHATTRKATGEKINITKGLVIPRSLSAGLAPPAIITYAAIIGGEDGAAAYAVTSAQTVPTAADLSEAFRAGDCEINSSSVGPIVSWNIDFGFEISYDWDLGQGVWPVMVSIDRHNPVITIRTKMPTALATVSVDGSALLVTCKLLKCAAGGGLAGANDLTFSTHENFITVTALGGSTGDKAETEIRAECLYDGANAPITVA